MSKGCFIQTLIIIKNKLLKFILNIFLFSLLSNKSDQKEYRKYLFLQSYFFSVVIIKLGGIDNLFNV